MDKFLYSYQSRFFNKEVDETRRKKSVLRLPSHIDLFISRKNRFRGRREVFQVPDKLGGISTAMGIETMEVIFILLFTDDVLFWDVGLGAGYMMR